MKASLITKQIPGVISKLIIISLVLTFVLASYPQPAQAACAFKYTVESGDTLYGIAATFQVEFEDLVEANKLTEPYIIYVGQVLCMPPGAEKPATTPVAGATTTAKKEPVIAGIHMGRILWVGVTNFSKERIYLVNVYEGTLWYVENGEKYWNRPHFKAGQFKTDKNGEFGAWFHIPKTYEDEWKITVCVKDILTDDVIGCTTATNYDYYMYK